MVLAFLGFKDFLKASSFLLTDDRWNWNSGYETSAVRSGQRSLRHRRGVPCGTDSRAGTHVWPPGHGRAGSVTPPGSTCTAADLGRRGRSALLSDLGFSSEVRCPTGQPHGGFSDKKKPYGRFVPGLCLVFVVDLGSSDHSSSLS